MMRKLGVGVMIVVLGTALLVGCGSSKKSSSSSSSAANPSIPANTIDIKSFAFAPKPVTVQPGATVTVDNLDGVNHTVTSDSKGQFDTGHVAGSASATFTAPTKTGTYKFHCAIHNYMTGTLVVK